MSTEYTIVSPDQPLRILIAEDNAVNMMVAVTILNRILPGATILEAANGVEAVEKYNESRPDIVFMDLQMPDRNGFEATEIIRRTDPAAQTPIIAITASDMKEERERCLQLGMNDFLHKPFVENAMIALLEKWIPPSAAEMRTITPEIQSSDSLHFNIAILKQYLSADIIGYTFLLEIMDATIMELRKLSTQIWQHDEQWEDTDLKRIGHKLYGTATTVGLMELSRMAADMQVNPGTPGEQRKLLLAQLKEELDYCIHLLEESTAQLRYG
ncbi:response regulator [Chitinophaga polysaccharea]|uniref:response regulator n=1 Tax=Chitinophaga polysaccharea TaxID=1293035 RepID=UPI001455C948|nr:response regulator [Chitinophaga polysaccharea]NLR58134.1 response regulator [Chitinophaga polysaccharea]